MSRLRERALTLVPLSLAGARVHLQQVLPHVLVDPSLVQHRVLCARRRHHGAPRQVGLSGTVRRGGRRPWRFHRLDSELGLGVHSRASVQLLALAVLRDLIERDSERERFSRAHGPLARGLPKLGGRPSLAPPWLVLLSSIKASVIDTSRTFTRDCDALSTPHTRAQLYDPAPGSSWSLSAQRSASWLSTGLD